MLPFTCKRPRAEIKPIVTRQELLNTFELMPTVSTGRREQRRQNELRNAV